MLALTPSSYYGPRQLKTLNGRPGVLGVNSFAYMLLPIPRCCSPSSAITRSAPPASSWTLLGFLSMHSSGFPLQKPLPASPRQLPRREPPRPAHLAGWCFSLLPFARGALLAARGGGLGCLRSRDVAPWHGSRHRGCPRLGT